LSLEFARGAPQRPAVMISASSAVADLAKPGALAPTAAVIASASEAIQILSADAVWIASSLSLLEMTEHAVGDCGW
jgi:hypothetical protein